MPRPLAVVTGAAGFIGARVVRALSIDHDVVGVGRGTARSSITMAGLAGIDRPASLVVHLAGGSSVGRSLEAPLIDFEQTLPPLAQVLEWLRTSSPTARLVLASSGAVYGDGAGRPLAEDAPLHPASPYGHHRRLAESLCASWAQTFQTAAVIVRLFSVYGPGQRKQLMWDACCKAREGDRTFHGTGDEARDWLHVDDAVALLLAASRSASPQVPIVNGGTGTATCVRAIVGAVFGALGAGEPTFSGATRAGDPALMMADVGRARALGWAPRVDVAAGVAEYVRWFGEQR